MTDLVHIAIDSMPQGPSLIHGYLPSIFAVCVGAVIALIGWIIQKRLLKIQFEHQKAQELKKVNDEHYIFARRILFILFKQCSFFADIAKTVEPYINDQDCWLKLPVILKSINTVPRIDVSSLSFLLRPNYDTNILLELTNIQDKFDHLLHLLERRNIIRREFEQILHSDCSNKDYFVTELKALTNFICTNIDKPIHDILIIRDKLLKAFKLSFPGKELVGFKMDFEKNANESSSNNH